MKALHGACQMKSTVGRGARMYRKSLCDTHMHGWLKTEQKTGTLSGSSSTPTLSTG